MSESGNGRNNENPQSYLEPGSFIDCDEVNVRRFARETVAGTEDKREAVIRIYYAIRDGITYDPYYVGEDPKFFRASACLAAGRGFCIPKAALMAACVRYAGIPARVGYADVRNHLRTAKLDAMIDGDIYVWHSYTEVYLDDCWIKATPVFNLSLCERFHVHPLEFNGYEDSLFQEFDRAGRRHMEYIAIRDHYVDVPYELILADFRKYHPRWLANRSTQASKI